MTLVVNKLGLWIHLNLERAPTPQGAPSHSLESVKPNLKTLGSQKCLPIHASIYACLHIYMQTHKSRRDGPPPSPVRALFLDIPICMGIPKMQWKVKTNVSGSFQAPPSFVGAVVLEPIAKFTLLDFVKGVVRSLAWYVGRVLLINSYYVRPTVMRIRRWRPGSKRMRPLVVSVNVWPW